MNSTQSRLTLGSLDLLFDGDGDGDGPEPAEAQALLRSGEPTEAATVPFELAPKGTRLSPESSRRAVGDGTAWSFGEIGSLIDGKYRVEGELGRGAMGVVVRARDESLGRQVALKLVRAELMTEGFLDRFRQEARAMARVNHVNVVQIYASGEHQTVPYFAMELVSGRTLEEWLEEQGGLVELGVALRILNGICEGLSAIHAVDTLHRDIKPSNILLGADLHPRIADLGVSTIYQAGRLSQPEIVGTPAYMAPEVGFPVPGQVTTPRADIYSLGCLAYELLTGESPFVAEADQECLFQHATAPVRPPSSVRPDLPTAFDAVLLRALAKDAEERTPTVEEFRRDLRLASGDVAEPVRILVAEDDRAFRELLEEHLRREFPDAEVTCTPNGLAALQALEERPASVAILDLNMPGLDGFEVTRRLRASERASTMPIIVLSGFGGPAEWRKLSSIGADRFLVKPVSLDDLVTSVRHSLRERARVSDAPPRMV